MKEEGSSSRSRLLHASCDPHIDGAGRRQWGATPWHPRPDLAWPPLPPRAPLNRPPVIPTVWPAIQPRSAPSKSAGFGEEEVARLAGTLGAAGVVEERRCAGPGEDDGRGRGRRWRHGRESDG